MLRAHVVRHLNIPLELCTRCLMDVAKFLGQSPYTERAEKVGEEYRIVFRWRKFGITRRYEVRLRVRKDGDGVVYEPAPGSPYRFSMFFRMKPGGPGETLLEAGAEMDAGLMADLFGKRDFQGFVEDLVDRGLTRLARELADSLREEATPGVSCLDCLLYERRRGYCYYLARRVEDPSRPPCRGEKYVAKIV